MFILPVPKSPGELGSEENASSAVPASELTLKPRIGVNGFIASALLIQAISIAGIMPAAVWITQPGYALTVCFGLIALSACILLSLRNLLRQVPPAHVPEQRPVEPSFERVDPVATVEPPAPEPQVPTALVIHNNLTTRLILEKSLAKAGIRCVCVDDDAPVERALAARSFGLIIFDGSSPLSRNGSFQRLRAGIPALALTAQKHDAAGLAADATIAMPIVPDDLARIAAQLIGSAPARAQAPAADLGSVSQRELPKIEPEPLDERALGDLEKLGGPDFVRDIVAQFVGDAAIVLANLSVAVAARDMKAFREEAHALRSCAANVGAQNVYRMCLAWRDLDAHEIAASGSQYMQMLEGEFERVQKALVPMLTPPSGENRSSQAA